MLIFSYQQFDKNEQHPNKEIANKKMHRPLCPNICLEYLGRDGAASSMTPLQDCVERRGRGNIQLSQKMPDAL
ncbi:MAG: hypothetical protein JNJ71_12600 [Rubrivivax sp.]|nr:hypothetical protein [Rubrivivax sp.]